MSSYFPIPNNFEISSNNDLIIESSITVLNYPNNSLLRNINKKKDKIYYYVYFLNNDKWLKCYQKECLYGKHLEIKRSDLDIPKEMFAVAIPSFNKNQKDELDILFKPSSTRNDICPVAERASYNFHINNSITSFQGEYPYELALDKKYSFFSFDSLRLDKNLNSKTFLILINLNKDSKKKDFHKVYFYKSSDKSLLKEIIVQSNSINNICLTDISEHNNSIIDPTFISCSTTTFIPIYVTIQGENNCYQISVEHTHPPSEMFWGETKYKSLEKLKSHWVLK